MHPKLLSTALALFVLGLDTAGAESLTSVSGRSGGIKAEIRINNGGPMAGLRIGEKSDNPCRVELIGRDGNTNAVTFENLTKCRNLANPGVQGISLDGKVTGLKVCLNNDKVKGWSLWAKTDSGSTISDTFKRPNCDQWMARVNCPSGRVAIGVKAHFYAGTGKKSDKLSGLQLICD